jgi:hypothetical protein
MHAALGTRMGKRAEGKREKRHKDPDAPKRPMSAFFQFCQEERPKVKKAHNDWKVGDIAKELGKRWEHVEKSKYEAEAARDKQRYEKEMAVYKATQAKQTGTDKKKSPKK